MSAIKRSQKGREGGIVVAKEGRKVRLLWDIELCRYRNKRGKKALVFLPVYRSTHIIVTRKRLTAKLCILERFLRVLFAAQVRVRLTSKKTSSFFLSCAPFFLIFFLFFFPFSFSLTVTHESRDGVEKRTRPTNGAIDPRSLARFERLSSSKRAT